MEIFELYVPNLKSVLRNQRGCREQRIQLLEKLEPKMNAMFLPDETRIYMNSVTLGAIQFQVVSFDLVHDKITFQRKSGCRGDGNRWIYELLSALQWDFLPKKMSYVMERPPQHIMEEKT